MNVELNDLNQFQKQFKKFFPQLNPSEYQDILVWQATRRVSIDIIKLDDWLQKEFPYENLGLSMREALTEKFGKDTSDFVAKWI